MSRIGKQKIILGKDVSANLTIEKGEQLLKIKGPLGELSRYFKPEIKIEIGEDGIKVIPTSESIFQRALWGTYASHIKNMVEGVTNGFKKNLIVEGIGFKVQVSGEKLVFNLGFSHQVEMKIPKGIKATAEKNNITIFGIDKELVGQFSENITALKKPEPYKGKGIRYEGQVIKLKQGKKTVS